MCRDFIQIVDLEIGKVLFNSCSEFAKPQQIISNSHQLNVSVTFFIKNYVLYLRKYDN